SWGAECAIFSVGSTGRYWGSETARVHHAARGARAATECRTRSGWADMARPPRKAATRNLYPPGVPPLNPITGIAGQRTKEKFTTLLHHVSLEYLEAALFQPLVVCDPTPGTRFPGPEPGACFAVPHSPWSPPFAPLARLCSSVS